MRQSEKYCKIRKAIVLIYVLLMAGFVLLWLGLYMSGMITAGSTVYEIMLKIIMVGAVLLAPVLLALMLITMNIGKLRRIEAEE